MNCPHVATVVFFQEKVACPLFYAFFIKTFENFKDN